jgi:hypothetical protein
MRVEMVSTAEAMAEQTEVNGLGPDAVEVLPFTGISSPCTTASDTGSSTLILPERMPMPSRAA